jgi:hypothetical protein
MSSRQSSGAGLNFMIPPVRQRKIILLTRMERLLIEKEAKEKKDKGDKKTKKPSDTTNPNGVVKAIKQPAYPINPGVRSRVILRLRRGDANSRNHQIAALTAEHLEPTSKHSWADPVQSNAQAMKGVEPVAFTWSGIPISPITPTFPSFDYLSLQSSASTFNGYQYMPTGRNKPTSEMEDMLTVPGFTMNITNGVERKIYYFAYGTDLSITTMEQMCPGTEYVAPATLPNYQWLIGSRNKPIIMPSMTEKVIGILYKVPLHYVTKLTVSSEINASAIPLSLTVDLFVNTIKNPENAGWSFGCIGPNVPGQHKALVFVAGGAETEGKLSWEEDENMIMEIYKGIEEAKARGSDAEWLDRVVRKSIPYPKGPGGIWNY